MRSGAQYEWIRGVAPDGKVLTVAAPPGGWRQGVVYEIVVTSSTGGGWSARAVMWDGKERGNARVTWNPPVGADA